MLPKEHVGKLVVPEKLVPTVLQVLHEIPTASHSGVDKVIMTARSRFFFPCLSS